MLRGTGDRHRFDAAPTGRAGVRASVLGALRLAALAHPTRPSVDRGDRAAATPRSRRRSAGWRLRPLRPPAPSPRAPRRSAGLRVELGRLRRLHGLPGEHGLRPRRHRRERPQERRLRGAPALGHAPATQERRVARVDEREAPPEEVRPAPARELPLELRERVAQRPDRLREGISLRSPRDREHRRAAGRHDDVVREHDPAAPLRARDGVAWEQGRVGLELVHELVDDHRLEHRPVVHEQDRHPAHRRHLEEPGGLARQLDELDLVREVLLQEHDPAPFDVRADVERDELQAVVHGSPITARSVGGSPDPPGLIFQPRCSIPARAG